MKSSADDLAAELLDELVFAFAVPPVASTSSWTSTRWPLPNRVGVHLERVRAVLERVRRARPSRHGSLPGLRAATKPQPSRHGERAAEDEAARLGAEDDVGLQRLGPVPQLVDRLAEVRRRRRAAA